MRQITAYCDGGIKGNGCKDSQGAAVALIIRESGRMFFLVSTTTNTTSNKEEVAAIRLVKGIAKKPAQITLFSDSIFALNMERIPGIAMLWTKGHFDDVLHNLADSCARHFAQNPDDNCKKHRGIKVWKIARKS